MSTGPEFIEVEQPFLDQLVAMGWQHIAGSLNDLSATDRESTYHPGRERPAERRSG